MESQKYAVAPTCISFILTGCDGNKNCDLQKRQFAADAGAGKIDRPLKHCAPEKGMLGNFQIVKIRHLAVAGKSGPIQLEFAADAGSDEIHRSGKNRPPPGRLSGPPGGR